ncbi:MAG TPA: hypothetical protein DCL54_19020 [Alphaproteobacteria bacterium]|nr:hypothetical protein [Alphaproteobacteria bacterium]HAJ48675.1 hypothetical protein [Alphaproteobacteria bacterium]
MFVCNCNGLREHAVEEAADHCQSVPELFKKMDCRPKCGRCVNEIGALIKARGRKKAKRRYHATAEGLCRATKTSSLS